MRLDFFWFVMGAFFSLFRGGVDAVNPRNCRHTAAGSALRRFGNQDGIGQLSPVELRSKFRAFFGVAVPLFGSFVPRFALPKPIPPHIQCASRVGRRLYSGRNPQGRIPPCSSASRTAVESSATPWSVLRLLFYITTLSETCQYPFLRFFEKFCTLYRLCAVLARFEPCSPITKPQQNHLLTFLFSLGCWGFFTKFWILYKKCWRWVAHSSHFFSNIRRRNEKKWTDRDSAIFFKQNPVFNFCIIGSSYLASRAMIVLHPLFR